MKNVKIALSSVALAILCFALSGAYIQTRMPPGTLLLTGRTSCPSYTVAADGSSLLRAGLYANLFSAISTTYGSADGTHFAVPNAKGVFLRGAGAQTISAISYSGSQGTTQGDQEQGHYHTLTDPGHTHTVNVATTASASKNYIANDTALGGSLIGTNAALVVNAVTGATVTAMTTDGSNGTPRVGTQTYPANISVLYCIWY